MELSEPYLLTSDRANKQTFTSVAGKLLTVEGEEKKMTGMGKSVLCCSQSSGIFSICLNCIIFFPVSNTAVTDIDFSSSNLFTLPIDTPVGLSSSFGLYHTKVMQLTVVVKEISALAPPEIH